MRILPAVHIIRICLLAAAIFSCVSALHAVQASAETTAPSVSCATLTTKLSDNKNFYILTATATGDDSVITGYTFNFGDHESFRFVFNPSSHDDRHTATTTHTYKTPGTYMVTAQVDIKVHGKVSHISSDTCKTSLPILPTGSALPNTGARNILGVGIVIAFLAAFWHHSRLRKRQLTDASKLRRTRAKRTSMRDA